MTKPKPPRGDSTRLIHDSRPAMGPLPITVGPPIQRGSTVLMPDAASLYDSSQISYGRGGLAAQNALTAALADMEGAVGCQLFPSGLAAMTGAMLAVLKAGDVVLIPDSIYSPTRRFCDKVLKGLGVTTISYPPRAAPDEVLNLGGPKTRLLLLESPGSLTFEIQDVAAFTALAKARGVLTLIDNTWAAGLLFKPLAHGVDLSAQALTKYVCGHSDVFMGSVATADPALAKVIEEAIWNVGWAVSPDDAYQALRGLRTLAVRLARHGDNGFKIASWLEGQPQVLKVLHPALPSSPDHNLWRRDFTGSCGLFGIVLTPGPAKAVDTLLDALKLFGLGFSWGGFESLAISCDPQLPQRLRAPKFDGPLIRLHVGLEDTADLIADLEAGLAAFDAAI
jgi:cystathionine beta-lyase